MAAPEVIAQRTVSSTREFSNICLFNYIGNVKLYEIVFRNNNFTFVVLYFTNRDTVPYFSL